MNYKTDWNYLKAKQIIESRGLKKKWVADKCGVRPRALREYLNGKTRPGLPFVKLLALALEIDEAALLNAKAA